MSNKTRIRRAVLVTQSKSCPQQQQLRDQRNISCLKIGRIASFFSETKKYSTEPELTDIGGVARTCEAVRAIGGMAVVG